MHTIDSMNHFFLSAEIIIVGRAISVGREKGDVEKDEEGLQWTRNLGRRMAWTLKRLHEER
jgi:multimeric flavodoxin WrbA